MLGAIIAWTIAGTVRAVRHGASGARVTCLHAPAEAALFGVIVLGAVLGVVFLATGAIEI